MTGKDLYNAISYIDEKYLVQYENEQYSVYEQSPRKTLINYSTVAAALVICAIAVFASKGFLSPSTSGVEENNLSTTVSITDHGGDGDLFIIDDTVGNAIPTELTVSTNLKGAVFYASDLDYSDPYSAEKNTPEQKDFRVSILKEFMNMTGFKNINPEYGSDDVFPYIDTGAAVITAFNSYLSIDTACVGNITYDSSDSEIMTNLKDNKYTNALMEYIDLNLENIYIYKENIFMYGDEKSTKPLSRMTIFKIANYSNNPQQLAFNLSTNYLMFKTVENYAENTTVISSVYGYFISKKSMKEIKDYLTYENAIENMSRIDNSFSSDTAICTVTYKPDTEKGLLMPYYEFHWNDGKEDKSFCIPLMI